MADFYIMAPTLEALMRYEENEQFLFVNRGEVLDRYDSGPIPKAVFDAGGAMIATQSDVPLGILLPKAQWRFDDENILPDIWGDGYTYLVSGRFQEAAGLPVANTEEFDVETSGTAQAAADQRNYRMLRLGLLETEALDMKRTTTDLLQNIRFVKDHVFRPGFVPEGPIFMTPESVYTFVTADLADRIQCAGITDVKFLDPTVRLPEIGYPPKPMPKDCP